MKKHIVSFAILGAVAVTTIIIGGKYIKNRLNVIPTNVNTNTQTSVGTFETDAQGNSAIISTDISVTSENVTTTSPVSDTATTDNMYLSNELAQQRYPYQQLSDTEKIIYTAIFKSVQNMEDSVTFPFDVDADTYKKIYSLFYREEAQFFYMNNSYHYSENPTNKLSISYIYTAEQVQTMQSSIDAKIDPIMQNINSLSSEYEKFLAIHDYIVSNCTYSLDSQEVNTIYGCLVNGMAGCEGYAKSIIYMAQKAGLNAMLISGTTKEGEHHAWNVVQIDNEFYNIDATWDDPIVASNDTAGISSNWHFYCLIPDEGFINTTHFAETDVFTPPICNSMNNNYYTKQSAVPTSYENAKQIIQQLLINAVNENKQLIEMRFIDNNVYNQTIQKLFNEQELFSILNDVNKQCDNKINATRFSQQTSNELQTIFIGIIYN